MTSCGNDQNAEYALSKLLQMGTVAEYESEFVILANRVTRISESLLTSFYISRLKVALQIELLRARPTSLGEAFLLARITEARFEAIAKKEKEHIIKKKADIIIALQSELASPEIKYPQIKFGEFSKNKKSMVEVVMGGGEALEVYREKSRGAAEDERRVLCYVQGSERLKKKKMEAQRRLWDLGIKSAF
uniref:Retrotransposon Gag protein n=1 Tax=Tanacetum cinerariifolium TaxID=118510 RepID=A0A6L2JM00_TANCI|nr:retrotransposon Gag protein [Tanacetum cinerariifolium]